MIGKNILTCASYAIGVLIVLVALIGFLIAKSGLFSVPLFSRFYHGPTPVRTVNAAPMSVDAFRTLIGARFYADELKEKKTSYTIRVTEHELTSVIQSVVPRSQIVIQESGLEFFGRTLSGFVHADVLVRLRPSILDKGIHVEPTEIRVGDYALPVSFAYQAVEYFFHTDLHAFNVGLGETRVHDIRLHDGYLEITAAP